MNKLAYIDNCSLGILSFLFKRSFPKKTSRLIIPFIVSVFFLMHLPFTEAREVPPEAMVLEITFQEQERKISSNVFDKYRQELTRFMNECVKNEDFEQAKHVKDILERRELPGSQENKDDGFSHFIGEWEELAGGYLYTSRFDGKTAQQRSGNSEWKSKGGIDKNFSSSDIMRINETQTVWFYWFRTDRDDRIFQINHSTKLVSLLKRKGGRKKETHESTVSPTSLKFDLLCKKINAEFNTGREKLARQYAAALQKKSKAWGMSGQLEAAIWARKRAQELQKGSSNHRLAQELSGTWNFPEGTVQIHDPEAFRMDEKNMTFKYIRSLNNSVHLFKVQETGQEKIVARVNKLLLIVPYDCRGPAWEGMMNS